MPERSEREVGATRAHLRHLKQYVQAPVHRFAAIVPPELTSICRDELTALNVPSLQVADAGVEFSGKLRAGYLANLALHTASRILCRLPSFRAGVVQELFHKVLSSRWELWLNPEIPLDVRGFVWNSRISHEGLVALTVLQGIVKRFQSQHLAPPGRLSSEGGESLGDSLLKQRVLVHLRENHCEISLDTTGDHLHRRGYRLEHTGAPLRETLAAAILLRSRWNGHIPLVDGMCGAGTIPIEAAMLARHLPPGGQRSFLFERWPCFQEKTWNHLRRELHGQALVRAPAPILALDEDAGALAVARKNAQRAGVDRDIRWQCADFFTFTPQAYQLPPGLLVLDPPYGKRLEGGGIELYERLGLHLRRFFQGWQIAILAPSKTLAMSLKIPLVRFWPLNHGGSPIIVALARL
jgi:putative N6-adenine-specific DNA methylase